MHFYPVAPELVSNRRHPKPRGAHTIRLEVARRARGPGVAAADDRRRTATAHEQPTNRQPATQHREKAHQ